MTRLGGSFGTPAVARRTEEPDQLETLDDVVGDRADGAADGSLGSCYGRPDAGESGCR